MTHPKQIGKSFEYRCLEKINDLGGICNRIPLSGASKDYKGDLTFSIYDIDFLAECKKTRGNKTWTIHRDMLDKIEKEATSIDREPILLFGFQRSPIYAIIELERFKKILDQV